MGNVLSRAKLILGAVYLLNSALDTLAARLKRSPGLPVPHPSLPFWTVPRSHIDATTPRPLPAHADVLVIGSGITGTSVAYHALAADPSLTVVVLEARDVCSGATGRNGGHINPPLWQEWKSLKEHHGDAHARALIDFRLAHVHDLQRVAAREGVLAASQVRATEHLEVHFTQDTFDDACAQFDAWRADMPDAAREFEACGAVEARERFHLADGVAGVIVGPGGAIHPYRFVTHLLANLLDRHSDRFSIHTQTPCTAIAAPTPSTPFYTVSTPKGTLTTPHVVHATNGWASHLLAPLREKIVPTRGTMSAQRPGAALHAATGTSHHRSYVFYPDALGYDYLTQLPGGEQELMFGGGWASASLTGALDEVGRADDTDYNSSVAAHLGGALPLYFGEDAWGQEKTPEVDDEDGVTWAPGRTKALWGGILGISADGLPWVGRVPPKLAGRAAPPAPVPRQVSEKEKQHVAATTTAAPGEWIAAGYSGEGMVHAWLSGKALAGMVLGREDDDEVAFPEVLRVTEARWRKAKLEEYVARKLGNTRE